ncbi:MAG: hypothetical protein A3I79_03910 [Gemmatimonadetes bacterium RIFCSPLOWO2_02_FULL_71_11]|nr:MAG: hypothetical protein A3I79_03910 [Gemmatimonadetes bacterium RIFCSPLOWO2_02_FULL_71_11]
MSADPLRAFEDEHKIALRALERLEQAALALRTGAETARHLAVAREVHGVLSTAVRAHNDAEERALFPLLEDDPTVAVFVEEHRVLRGLEQELADGLAAADGRRVAGTALRIVDLLRAHIEREDHMLFPSARAALGADGLAEVARRLGG